MKWVKGLRRIILVVGIGVAIPLGGWIALDTYNEALYQAYRVATVAELDTLCEAYYSADFSAYASTSCPEDDQSCVEQFQRLRELRAERDPDFNDPERQSIERVFWRLFPNAASSGEDAPPVSRMCGHYLTSLQINAYPMPISRYVDAVFLFLLYVTSAAFLWWIIGPIARLLSWLVAGFKD